MFSKNILVMTVPMQNFHALKLRILQIDKSCGMFLSHDIVEGYDITTVCHVIILDIHHLMWHTDVLIVLQQKQQCYRVRQDHHILKLADNGNCHHHEH